MGGLHPCPPPPSGFAHATGIWLSQVDLSYYLTANNSVGCTCSSLHTVHHSQNRPIDTQIHIVMKTPEQFYMFAFAIAMSKSDQFIEVFFSCKCMKSRKRDNYVLCANLLSPLSCANAETCYPILKTTSTCGPDSSVFDLKFMLSLLPRHPI